MPLRALWIVSPRFLVEDAFSSFYRRYRAPLYCLETSPFSPFDPRTLVVVDVCTPLGWFVPLILVFPRGRCTSGVAWTSFLYRFCAFDFGFLFAATSCDVSCDHTTSVIVLTSPVCHNRAFDFTSLLLSSRGSYSLVVVPTSSACYRTASLRYWM